MTKVVWKDIFGTRHNKLIIMAVFKHRYSIESITWKVLLTLYRVVLRLLDRVQMTHTVTDAPDVQLTYKRKLYPETRKFFPDAESQLHLHNILLLLLNL